MYSVMERLRTLLAVPRKLLGSVTGKRLLNVFNWGLLMFSVAGGAAYVKEPAVHTQLEPA